MPRRRRRYLLPLLGLGALGAAAARARASTEDEGATVEGSVEDLGGLDVSVSTDEDTETIADTGRLPSLPGWRDLPRRGGWSFTAAGSRLGALLKSHGYRAGAEVLDRLDRLAVEGVASDVYEDATIARIEALAERLAETGAVDADRATWTAAAIGEASRLGVPLPLAVQWATAAAGPRGV